MSDQQVAETGSGFIVGADPSKPPLTQAELQRIQTTEGQPVVITTPQGQRVFTEQDVARIREEEKTKLYDRMKGQDERLSSMDSELKAMRAEREQREAERAAEQQRLADEAKAREEQEMDVRQLLERRDNEWEARFAAIQDERAKDQAIFEQERRFNQVQIYRRDRIEQEAEWILPELRDLIVGGDEGEVDEAIEVMKQRTAAIVENIQATLTQQRQPIRGVSPTGGPPVGPMEQQTAVETLSEEDIRKMDPRDYAKYRDRLLSYAHRAGSKGLSGQ
jgi:hypothetical protein